MSDEQREKEQERVPKNFHFTLAYICAVARVVFRRENAWPTGLLAAFVWREVASPTAFDKKNKPKIIILKTTRSKSIFICDQQQEKEQGN